MKQFTTCEQCGKDSANEKGYCAECDYTTAQGTACQFCKKVMRESANINECLPCGYWEEVTA